MVLSLIADIAQMIEKKTDQKANCNIKREAVATVLIANPRRLLELSYRRDHARETQQQTPEDIPFQKYEFSGSTNHLPFVYKTELLL